VTQSALPHAICNPRVARWFVIRFCIRGFSNCADLDQFRDHTARAAPR